MWIHIDVAFDTFLSHVSPGVSTHPLPLTLGALVLAKASFFPLIGCESFAFGSGLGKEAKIKTIKKNQKVCTCNAKTPFTFTSLNT